MTRSRTRSGFGVVLWLVLVLATACGESAEAPSGSAAPAMLEPGGFAVAPRAEAIARERFDPETGSLERLGLTLPAQILAAWGLRAGELKVQIDLPEGAFDVRARPADGNRETAEALIRGGLSEHFGFVVERGRWTGEVLALRLAGEGLAPEPVASDAKPAGEDVRKVGEYRVHAAPISDLVEFLGWAGDTPIVDATELDERYDLVVEWDPSHGPRALTVALADAGFELVRERGRVELWVARAPR